MGGDGTRGLPEALGMKNFKKPTPDGVVLKYNLPIRECKMEIPGEIW
jgi:hypothetical protein